MPISDELETEIRHVAAMGMTERDSAPLLRELAERFNERKFRVRAAFRLVRQTEEKTNDD